MYWPKFSERKLFLLLKKQRKAKAGCSANYIRWTKYVGLKLFLKKRVRDKAYDTQALAARHKLGPRLGSKLIEVELLYADTEDEGMVPVLRTRKWYGYFTEHMAPAERRWVWGPKREKQEMEIYEALQAIGIYHGDLHEGNVSFTRGRNRPVCIDFGPESCYTGRPRKKAIKRSDLKWSKFC